MLQTVIPPLLLACGTSRLTLAGGTHVPFSPSWHYLREIFVPTLSRLGANVELALESSGFYPKGGGRVRCLVEPVCHLFALAAEDRGELLRVSGCSVVANLPRSIAERQARSALAQLESVLGGAVPKDIEIKETAAFGQGSFIFLKGEYRHAVAGFTALGARGKPAEQVGDEAAREFLAHHGTGMPIDPHLADQLVLYLAQAQAPSVFATSRISGHLETNLQIAGLFIDIGVQVTGQSDGPGTVMITPKDPFEKQTSASEAADDDDD